MTKCQENTEEKLRHQLSHVNYSSCPLAGQGHETEKIKATVCLKSIEKCLFWHLKYAYIQ